LRTFKYKLIPKKTQKQTKNKSSTNFRDFARKFANQRAFFSKAKSSVTLKMTRERPGTFSSLLQNFPGRLIAEGKRKISGWSFRSRARELPKGPKKIKKDRKGRFFWKKHVLERRLEDCSSNCKLQLRSTCLSIEASEMRSAGTHQ